MTWGKMKGIDRGEGGGNREVEMCLSTSPKSHCTLFRVQISVPSALLFFEFNVTRRDFCSGITETDKSYIALTNCVLFL